MVRELTGQVAVVTGGAAGIGRAIAERFAAEGARVVIADINAERGEKAAAECGPDVAFHQVDVGDSDQVRGLVSATVAQFGGLHVLVNNAGVPAAIQPSFLQEDLGDFDRIMRVDLLGVMLGTQHAARHMAEHGGGSVVNISSIAGVQAGTTEIMYRAAKAGVAHFTRSVAIDLAEHAIRVNCIAPGAIRTEIVSTATAHLADPDAATRRLREVMKSIRPLEREGTVADIAEAALYLASDRSRYVTGTVLPVDGGITAGNTAKHLVFRLADPAQNGAD